MQRRNPRDTLLEPRQNIGYYLQKRRRRDPTPCLLQFEVSSTQREVQSPEPDLYPTCPTPASCIPTREALYPPLVAHRTVTSHAIWFWCEVASEGVSLGRTPDHQGSLEGCDHATRWGTSPASSPSSAVKLNVSKSMTGASPRRKVEFGSRHQQQKK